jgi:hypothetical protein
VRALAAAAFWWILLVFLWLLYAGAFSKEQLAAATLGSLVAVGVGALIGRLGLLRHGLDYHWLAQARRLPWSIVREFGVVCAALVRGRPQGAFRTLPFPAGGDDPASAGRRALVGALAAISPNVYVVDFDCERQRVLVYELDPKRSKNVPL